MGILPSNYAGGVDAYGGQFFASCSRKRVVAFVTLVASSMQKA